MSSEQGYNGWKNYETWLVALWLDNEEGSYRYWNSAAYDAMGDVDGEAREASRNLAEQLKSEIEEGTPELTGLYADLINAALSEVDWYEIAEHYISDCGWEPDEEEVEEDEDEDTDEEE